MFVTYDFLLEFSNLVLSVVAKTATVVVAILTYMQNKKK